MGIVEVSKTLLDNIILADNIITTNLPSSSWGQKSLLLKNNCNIFIDLFSNNGTNMMSTFDLMYGLAEFIDTPENRIVRKSSITFLKYMQYFSSNEYSKLESVNDDLTAIISSNTIDQTTYNSLETKIDNCNNLMQGINEFITIGNKFVSISRMLQSIIRIFSDPIYKEVNLIISEIDPNVSNVIIVEEGETSNERIYASFRKSIENMGIIDDITTNSTNINNYITSNNITLPEGI